MVLDTDNFENIQHFSHPWFVLIRTTIWGAIAINEYVGFLDEELMSI